MSQLKKEGFFDIMFNNAMNWSQIGNSQFTKRASWTYQQCIKLDSNRDFPVQKEGLLQKTMQQIGVKLRFHSLKKGILVITTKH